MTGGRLGHAVLAGAIGGSAIACGAASGPLLATLFDLAAAGATAGIAAHAVEVSARERRVSSAGILHRTARVAVKRIDAPLAAHAVDVACRARKGDARALRAAAILLGRATAAHARGLALQLFGSWSAPLRDLSQLAAPLAVARAALGSSSFVAAAVSAVPLAVSTHAPIALESVWSGTDRAAIEWPFVGPFAETSEESGSLGSKQNRAEDHAESHDWEVAA
jgi:hypothetical protein